jgi:hypothetical protein
MKTKRVPIADVDAALRVYYGNGHINNDQIKKMFNITSPSMISKLKKPVWEAEKKEDIPVVVPGCINAKIAFRVWDINVGELEKNRKKRLELGL